MDEDAQEVTAGESLDDAINGLPPGIRGTVITLLVVVIIVVVVLCLQLPDLLNSKSKLSKQDVGRVMSGAIIAAKPTTTKEAVLAALDAENNKSVQYIGNGPEFALWSRAKNGCVTVSGRAAGDKTLVLVYYPINCSGAELDYFTNGALLSQRAAAARDKVKAYLNQGTAWGETSEGTLSTKSEGGSTYGAVDSGTISTTYRGYAASVECTYGYKDASVTKVWTQQSATCSPKDIVGSWQTAVDGSVDVLPQNSGDVNSGFITGSFAK